MPIKPLLLALITTALIAIPTIANASIEHRKSDLSVKVQSQGGTPLEGATVEIEMLNHAFRFGVSVEAGAIEQGNGIYDPTTVANLQKYFNSVTYGNVMKWSYYEARTEQRMLELVNNVFDYNAFEGSEPMRLRGHATVWGASYQIPSDARAMSDPTQLSNRILQHVSDYHTTFKDAGVDNFDLYNEHFHERALLIEKIVTSGSTADEAAEVAKWFNKAKEVDPNVVLFINEYNILNFWQENDSDVIAYKNFVDAIRDAGGQIDGIGLQAHMDRMTSQAQLTRRFNILSAPMEPTTNYPNGLPGLRLEVTELDINTQYWTSATAEQQATMTENILVAAFEHPYVDGITMWGMNDSDHWRDNAILFDDSDSSNWVVKPSGQKWIDYTTDTWWEDYSGASDANGDYAANTFNGTHKVTVTFNGITKETIVNLSEDETLTFNYAFGTEDAATYDAWAGFIQWDGSENAVRTADPDGDGRNNLEEYLTGTDPLAKDDNVVPYFQYDEPTSMLLKFATRASNENIAITVEISHDLVEWTDVTTTVMTAAPLPDPIVLVETVNGQKRYEIDVGFYAGEGFYRVKLVETGAQ